MFLTAAPRPTRPDRAPLWPPLLASLGRGSESTVHAHHAMHLVMCRDARLLRVKTSARGRPSEAAGVLTRRGVPHAIDAHDTDIVLVFVDPESELGGALEATLEGPMRLFTLEERDALLGNLDAVGAGFDALVSWAERTLGQIAGVPVRTREVHPRVRKLLRLLRTQLADADADVSLPHLAGLVGLSEGRLVHVFSESMGIPLRRYLLWMKLQRATAAVVSGMSLGEAAAEAGFSDSAHMSRTFRRMFGMTPSALRGQFRNSSSEG